MKKCKLKKKVFLGGTWNGSTWRNELIPLLKIDYFNPIVKNWTEECIEIENEQKKLCDYCLYVITPKMDGLYSIAEAVDDSNKRPEKTIFCILKKDEYLSFKESALKSLITISKLIEKNGGKVFTSLKDVANYLNKK